MIIDYTIRLVIQRNMGLVKLQNMKRKIHFRKATTNTNNTTSKIRGLLYELMIDFEMKGFLKKAISYIICLNSLNTKLCIATAIDTKDKYL